MAVDCLTANCDEGTNAAAEAAIMAPRARENFIVGGWMAVEECWVEATMGYEPYELVHDMAEERNACEL